MLKRDATDSVVAGRVQRSTPDLLRNLRHLRVLVFHPKDADGEMLVRQLQRIGCQVLTMWPPLSDLPETVDAVFCAVLPDHAALSQAWMGPEPSVALIAVLSYENPTIVDAALRMGAHAMLAYPVRSSGILSSLAMSLQTHQKLGRLRSRLVRLEQKLLGAQHVQQAKTILMRTHGIGDSEAYRVLREQAMSRRVSIEEIARAIVHAEGLLAMPAQGQIQRKTVHLKSV